MFNFLKQAAEKQHPYLTVELALFSGYTLHGFTSGGGLRVLSLSKIGDSKTFYGEAPTVDEAFEVLAEDLAAGGREYKDVYGVLRPHYWTGAGEPSSKLDEEMLKRHYLDAKLDDLGKIEVQIDGYSHTEVPDWATKAAMAGNTVWWEDLVRGFKYSTGPYRFPNGEMGSSSEVTFSPPNKDAWLYQSVRTGKGITLDEAIDNCLEAEPVEKMK